MSDNLTDRVPDAERTVAGSAVLEPASVRSAARYVTPDDFADIRLGRIYGLAAGMLSSGLHVDTITITQEVARRKAASVGADRRMWLDPAELVDLWKWSEPSTVEFHAKIVRDESVRRQVASTAQRLWHQAQAGQDAATLPTVAIEAFKEIRDNTLTDRLPTKTLGEVLAGSDEYDWVLPGLLERGDRVIITGGEGAGKSTMIRQIAVLAAAGLHPFHGHRVEPVKVLVVDAENSERQWRRKARGLAFAARRDGTVDPNDALHLANVKRMDVTTDRDLGAIHELLDEHTPDLLFIGPLYRLVPRAITNDDDAAPLIAALDSLRDRGPALVMEAHAGHAQIAGGGRDLRPRGSSALMGWPEFGFGIQMDGQQPQLAHLVRWRGDRDERDWPDQMERGGKFPWSIPAWTPHGAVA